MHIFNQWLLHTELQKLNHVILLNWTQRRLCQIWEVYNIALTRTILGGIIQLSNCIALNNGTSHQDKEFWWKSHSFCEQFWICPIKIFFLWAQQIIVTVILEISLMPFFQDKFGLFCYHKTETQFKIASLKRHLFLTRKSRDGTVFRIFFHSLLRVCLCYSTNIIISRSQMTFTLHINNQILGFILFHLSAFVMVNHSLQLEALSLLVSACILIQQTVFWLCFSKYSEHVTSLTKSSKWA